MEKLSKQTEENLAQLQLLEQNLQNFVLQRQNFQMQLSEIETALNEIARVNDMPFKIIGSVMVATKKEDLKKDLESKKEILDLRIKSLEKQENSLREKANNLQQSIMKDMQKQGV